jgi:hypothetical protein
VEDRQVFGGFQSGDFSGRGERLDGSVAEPAIIEGEVAGGGGGLEMAREGEVEVAFVDACGLEFVDVAAEQGEGYGAADVDAGIFEFAVDVERDGDETAGSGFGEVAGPLVDADGADDLLGLGDLVHLSPGGGAGENQSGKENAMGVSHRPVIELDAIWWPKSYRPVL